MKKRYIVMLLAGVGVIALLAFSAGVAGGAQYYYAKKGGYIQGVNKGVNACWYERNTQMPEGHEKICGSTTLMPADAMLVSVGDDNFDGIIDEDESGWQCQVMGNRICNPTS